MTGKVNKPCERAPEKRRPKAAAQEPSSLPEPTGPLTWYYCGKCRAPTDIDTMWEDKEGMFFCKECK